MTLSERNARRIYDRLGDGQDRQAFYEDPALAVLLREGRFPEARAVVEVGCGTGRLAAELLGGYLPPGARYLAVDLSAAMTRLAAARLAPFGERAAVVQASVAPGLPLGPAATGRFDRFVSTYLLDLLPEDAVRTTLSEAHRLLAPGGLLCLAGIAPGTTPLSRLVMAAWTLAHRLRPSLLGGCRPLAVAPRLDPAVWRRVHREVVVARGIASEVVVAERAKLP